MQFIIQVKYVNIDCQFITLSLPIVLTAGQLNISGSILLSKCKSVLQPQIPILIPQGIPNYSILLGFCLKFSSIFHK